MSSGYLDSRCWRARADEARAYAEAINDRQMAERLNVIADHYDALATRTRAEEHRQQFQKQAGVIPFKS
jgi:hypothetical protein